jgi:hypothetical protein
MAPLVEGYSLGSRRYTTPPTSSSFGRRIVAALLRRRSSPSKNVRKTESEELAAIGHGPSNVWFLVGKTSPVEKSGGDEWFKVLREGSRPESSGLGGRFRTEKRVKLYS